MSRSASRLAPGLSVQFVDSIDEKSHFTNSWTNVEASSFQVRQPNYSRLKQKAASENSLYQCVAVDVYHSQKKIGHVGRLVELPLKGFSDSDLKDSYLPAVFIVNFSIPSYPVENAIWGKNPEDGDGYNLVMYYTVSEQVRELMRNRRDRIAKEKKAKESHGHGHGHGHGKKHGKKHKKQQQQDEHEDQEQDEEHEEDRWAHEDDAELPNSVRLLHRFTSPDTDPELHLRFKCISRIVNVDDAGIGGAAKKLVQTYNGTPFLIKTTSVFHHGDKYFEVDVDVHRFSYLARLGLSGVRERIKDVIFDIAFVVEGHEETELPEQLLSAQRLSKLDLSASKTFPEEHLPEEHKS